MERRKRQKSDGRQNHIAQSDRTGGDLWIRFRLGRNFYISPIAHVWSPLSRRLHRSEAGCWARSRAGVFGEHLTKALPTRSRQFNDAWVMESLIMELRKLEEAAKLLHRETDMSVSSSAECQGSDTLHPMKRPLKSPVQHCVCQQSNCCGRTHTHPTFLEATPHATNSRAPVETQGRQRPRGRPHFCCSEKHDVKSDHR